MSKEQGLIIHFDEERRNDLLRDYRDQGFSFSDALSVADWEVKQLQIVLLSFTGSSIDYICLAIRGNRVVTGKYHVEFTDLVELHSIPKNQIEECLSSNTKLHFVKSSQGSGGRIPHKTWLEVIEALKKLRPDQNPEIERLLSIKTVSKYRIGGPAGELLLQEREALGAALDVFSGSNDLRKKVLRSWAPQEEDVTERDDKKLTAMLVTPKDEVPSFLNGIASEYIQEESALQHDLFNWEDIKASSHVTGVSTFYKGSRVLNVVYANKNDLEHTLGVDLIYYIKKYHSFVLVQYKLMKEETNLSGFVYRPDSQIDEELKRMNEFNSTYKASPDFKTHEQYRINTDGFFFKLVPNRGVQAASEKLISGMYTTREYMKFLLGVDGPKGKKGGRLINFDNSPRYMTNTEFATAINRGWIGSRSNQSDILEQLITRFRNTGRALLIAVEVGE